MKIDKHEIVRRFACLPQEKQKAFLEVLKDKGIDFGQLPIYPAGRNGVPLALSYAQVRQWFLWQLESGSTAYHISGALKLRGDLDVEALKTNFEALVVRHESLRTVFRAGEDGLAEQVIQADGQAQIEEIDLSAVADEEREAKVREVAARLHQTPFDLKAGPLLRVGLIREAADEHVLVVVMHHIISDGWSMQIIVDEFVAQYRAQVQGQAPQLAPLPIQYADYAVWQRNWLEAGEKDRQLAYWKAQLGDDHPVLQLPADHPRKADGVYSAARHGLELPSELVQGLHQRERAEGATLFMVLLAGVQALLHRYSGQQDIRVGVPIANRHRVETEGVVGFFVNTQVLRNVIGGRLSLAQVLKQAKEAALGAQTHQDLPFEQLVEALQPERNLGTNPLFQVMFNHQRQDHRALQQLPGLTLEDYALGEQHAQFELTVDTVEDADGQVRVSFTYAEELFEASTIERMAGHYVALLQALADRPQEAVGDVELLTDAERQQLKGWGENLQRYPGADPVHRLIEQQAQAHPEAVALLFGDEVLSYGELNTRANRLAHRLIKLGVKPEVKVGIAVERSLEMVVGLLGILKAGGAYVPLDPEYPADRLAYMVGDSGIGLLLTQRAVKERLPVAEGLVVLELDGLDLAKEPMHNPDVAVHGENLAYVIYTSGSTGRPKGVGIPHHSLVEHAQVAVDFFGLTNADRMLQFATLNFDGCIEQLFPPLVKGASVVLRGPALWDSTTFHQQLLDKQISVVDITTAYWLLLVQDFARQGIHDYGVLRQLHAGGEAMPPEGLNAWRAAGLAHVKLLNTYGPTEATVTASILDCHPYVSGGKLLPLQMPIGTPLAGRALWVVDADLNPAPSGVAGELLIGGDLLARGYLGRPSLSAERFVADPFGEAGGRLYRTGDLVRWNGEGQLEYLGRIDHQVKIRGFRIELGEVEAQLLSQPEVREAVVVAKEGPGGARLVGYVSAQAGKVIEVSELRERLGRALPDYMVPSVIVAVESLPLNANGKVDRKALPEPGFESGQEYEAPQGEVEEALARIWSEVLGVERVGRHDNFFELGGDSLRALRLVAAAKGASLTLRDVMARPTLAGMLKNRETVRHNAEHFARLNSLCWTRSPLFCLHAGEGTSFPYLPLARHLDQVRTVFGVSCRRILNHDHHDESLVTMAADYAQSIRHIQPKGPYYLLGWSLGGALASLVANQLETQCEHVAMLSLVDPLIPGTDEAQEENWKESLREFVETVLPNSYMNRFDELIMRAENSAEETVAGILRELVADEKAPDAIALPKLEMGIAGVGPDLLARGFCVARYLRELARSIDALPPTFVAPHCWWDSNRPESHRLALYAQLGQPAASTELVSAHSEMMNDDALSMALVQLLS